jgi:hypothetical protein
MRNVGGEREIRGPANDTVPTWAIRNKETKGGRHPGCTYRCVPGNDLSIGQSQETLVNPCLVQLWQAHEIARYGRSSCDDLGMRMNRRLTLVRLFRVVHQSLYDQFDLRPQSLWRMRNGSETGRKLDCPHGRIHGTPKEVSSPLSRSPTISCVRTRYTLSERK